MNIAFITGVSTGIGRASLDTLIDKGFHVIGSVRKSTDSDQILQKHQKNCTILTFDVRDVETTQKEIDRIKPLLQDHGLSVLINNAGVAVPGPLLYLTEEEFETQLDINVKSVRRITNALLPYLGVDTKYKPGKIINISSVSGLFNSPFNGAYCISKHALESMNDVYRRELMLFGIQVSAIEPGPIKTEIWQKNLGSLDKFKDGVYGEFVKSADKMIKNAEKSALPVEDVTDVILKIIQSPSPKTRYLVHSKKLFFRILSKWIPDKIADKLILKTLKAGDKHRPF